MAKNYTITFKSLRAGTTYVVNIGGGTGTAVPLMGGAQPFTTQEDDDEDMFTPIRTQSGYLRIVDNGKDANGNAFDWKDLIPATDTSRPVILSHVENNQTVIDWQGFMQAQDFGNTLYGNPQEREFPIQCPLTVLDTFVLNPTLTSLRTFGEVIHMVLSSLDNVTIDNIYFQGGEDAAKWLQRLVQPLNYLAENENNTMSAAYDPSQILEDVCRFWGWTVRIHETSVYFMMADDTAEDGILKTDLAGLLTLDDDTTYEIETFSGHNIQVPDKYASTNNVDSRKLPYSTAAVSADSNSAGTLMETWPESDEWEMIDSGWTTVGTYDTDKFVRITSDITMSVNKANIIGTAIANKSRLGMLKEGSTQGGSNEYSNIRLLTQHDNNDTLLASLETKYQAGYGDGYFTIKGKICLDNAGILTDEKKMMWMRLGIGSSRQTAKWLKVENTGAMSWSSTMTSFRITMYSTDGAFRIRLPFPEAGDNAYTTSDMLPVGTPMAGKVFVDFLGSDDYQTINVCEFSMTFFRAYNNYSGSIIITMPDRFIRDMREYKADNGNAKKNEWGTDCIFASDNNSPFGYGLVLDEDLKYMQYAEYGLTTQRPEQHLANRVASYWQNSKRKVYMELLTHDGSSATTIASVTPRHTVTIDGTTAYPISISRQWRDDVLQLTVLEL